ncbi:acetyl-CoA C-acetyltransferase [Saccharopolyspora erythraea NRRL 2338]|uniref:Acetyl-CoA acetyltransferase n=2 Tax=Saccharopolyspora erythraea TaxID=1836 RepID=A4FD92_SACEN|nr:acetyl-CoA C-acetyltransferase [Saccharopolyspora erythraea]EQD83518.1 acetyl-CoA acetyltransferase [Saccharopolyspora erythraea D]PFG95760.1 acetyl-CoA C-acetyltransferase [Saccharopolyspora erythraea NRRL 2338]QRK92350.1 acetyl-CoA C-acetyltransferase [Saccharopolyspora erythraea]CAM02017.1 acetyl-CoA acetyltransferase [Saccharopolyspora erythraea NRRL 2338]
MPEAYIVEALRSPVGRRGGGLSALHPNDLGGRILAALVERTGIDPAAVDDVIFGCVGQMGAQSANVARNAWLSAGLPESVPATTVDRQCGSAQQAIHFAAQAVLSGTQDLVIAGGLEVMSRVPIASPAVVGQREGMGFPYDGEGWRNRYGDQEISQFRGAELIAEKWSVSREDMEELALDSHQRALAAIDDGAFTAEIVPVDGLAADEGPRPDSSLEKMAGLKPLREGGRITAAVSSQISDGACALLLASEQAVRTHGLTPLARIQAMAVVGSDPVFMLTGPIPATEAVLAKAGVEIDDVDLFEVNEAFASVVLAWLKETGAPWPKTNVLGGAIALGHPLGATGARLMTTMLHHLGRTGGRYGLQTMCEGGGMANATLVERL